MRGLRGRLWNDGQVVGLPGAVSKERGRSNRPRPAHIVRWSQSPLPALTAAGQASPSGPNWMQRPRSCHRPCHVIEPSGPHTTDPPVYYTFATTPHGSRRRSCCKFATPRRHP